MVVIVVLFEYVTWCWLAGIVFDVYLLDFVYVFIVWIVFVVSLCADFVVV